MENLDDCFRTVSVGFEAEGQEAAVMTVGLGDSLALDRIPQLEVGEQEQYQWVLRPDVTSEVLSMGETEKVHYLSQERLTGILFDQTYEARYDTKNTVVASEEKTAGGRNLALAVGAFDKGTTLSLTQSGLGPEGISAGEVWQVTVSDIGVEKLHYHIGEDAQQILLYVKDSNGSWVQRSFTVEGSYMIFEFTQGETAFALEVLPAEEFPVAAVALGAGGLVLLLILRKVMKSRKAKKKGTVREG